jgi:hypothetical protein
MPEDPSRLHVLGVTADGLLFHTMRRPDGWAPWKNVFFSQVPQLTDRRGHVTEVAAARLTLKGAAGAGVSEGVFVVVTTTVDAHPITLFRNADTNTWRVEPERPIPRARRIAAAVPSTNNGTFFLHTSWVQDNGRLFGTANPLPLTGAIAPVDVETAVGLPFGYYSRAVAAAGFDFTTPLLTRLVWVADDGRLWTALLQPSGTATLFQDVEALAGDRGAFKDVAIAIQRSGSSETFNIGGVTGDGSAWLTRLTNAFSATAWRNLEEVDTQISGGSWEGHLRMVVDVGTFERTALGVTSEGLHVLAVTTDGRLLHQLDPSPGQIFRDVELVGVGQDAGSFVGVACA